MQEFVVLRHDWNLKDMNPFNFCHSFFEMNDSRHLKIFAIIYYTIIDSNKN